MKIILSKSKWEEIGIQKGWNKIAGIGKGDYEKTKPYSPYKTLNVETYIGKQGEKTHLTRKETGTIPTDKIKHLQGESGEIRGEHRHKQNEEWEKFKQDIKENGIQYPIFIIKEPNKKPTIWEGNHRLDAAIELGLKEVPVEIRYFGKSEINGLAY